MSFLFTRAQWKHLPLELLGPELVRKMTELVRKSAVCEPGRPGAPPWRLAAFRGGLLKTC